MQYDLDEIVDGIIALFTDPLYRTMIEPELLPPDGIPTTYRGGPQGGQEVLVPGGLPPSEILSGWDATGRYVWTNGRHAPSGDTGAHRMSEPDTGRRPLC